MIFTAEEYSDLKDLPSMGVGGRSIASGDDNHIRDHNAIARLLWGPGPDGDSGKTTIMKLTKQTDHFLLGNQQLPLDFPELQPIVDGHKPIADFYDAIVSQEGLLDLPVAEWPVGAWFEVFADGLFGLSMKAGDFFYAEEELEQMLNLGGIWTIFKYTADIKKHIYTSGQWTPALPEQTDDMTLFNGNYFTSSYDGYYEGEIIYSIRPKHIDTVKDLTARIEPLENSNGTLSATVSDLEADVSALTADKETLDGKVSTLESDSATLNTTVSQLGEDVTALSTASSTLEGKVSTLESDNVSLNTTVSGLETDFGSLSSANDTLSSTVSTLEGNVATLTSDKEALEGQVSTLESTIADLTSRLEALENPTSPE